MPTAVIMIRKEPYYRRAAFISGLKRIGYDCTTPRMTDTWIPSGPDDLLVLWNKKAGLDEKMADIWEERGGTVIVAENAYLQKVDKTRYAISTHGHNGSGWFPKGNEDRFTPLGFELKDWKAGSSAVEYSLVCGQRSIGSKLMQSPVQWGEKFCRELAAKNRPFKFRPHPGNFAPKTPLTDDLAKADRCFIWSSSAGVLALVEGVFPEHHAPHWICETWLSETEHVNTTRPRALNHMAHGQWSIAEIESGEPFARMKSENWGPRWR